MHLKMKHEAATNAATVSPSSLPTLAIPVWAAIVRMTAQPSRAVLAARVAGFALPPKATTWGAKWVFLHLARITQMSLAALMALYFDFRNSLGMIRTSWHERRPPLRFASLRAIEVLEAFNATRLANKRCATS